MKKISFLIYLVVCTSLLCFGLPANPDPDAEKRELLASSYPVPPASDKLLFYVQRSKNTNTIVYEPNFAANGHLVENEPVRAYWIQYAGDGGRTDLNYIQKKYAYGIKGVPVKGHEGQYILNFVSYEKKKLYLVSEGEGKRYHVYVPVNGRMAELKRIFIFVEGGTFWLPNIVDIEITAKDPSSHQLVTEHFKP